MKSKLMYTFFVNFKSYKPTLRGKYLKLAENEHLIIIDKNTYL